MSWRPTDSSSGARSISATSPERSSTSSIRIYYPCLDATRGRPFGVYLHANDDATGALRALTAITTGLGWVASQAPLVVTGAPSHDDLSACRELGAAVAAGLTL